MYLFNENTLYENIVNMGKAFHRYYGNTYAAYSFKTNYLADICQIVNEAGLLAEVVSPYERMYAMELGFTPDRIVYNGVIPNTAEKVKLASCGGSEGAHQHHVLVPEKMRSLKPGDRVLVAWVQNEAVVVDIVVSS